MALAFGASALAKTAPQTHEMTVALPDGAVAHIQYTGEKPVVTVSPDTLQGRWLSDWRDPLWRPWDAGTLDIPDISQITANIDREMAAMRADMERFDHLAQPGLATSASNAATTGFCAHSVEVTRTGTAAPRVEEHTYGNCGDSGHSSSSPPAAHPATRT
ncbi:MAG: hypothetical protein ABUL55_01740 [Pseudomonadota bacterium]